MTRQRSAFRFRVPTVRPENRKVEPRMNAEEAWGVVVRCTAGEPAMQNDKLHARGKGSARKWSWIGNALLFVGVAALIVVLVALPRSRHGPRIRTTRDLWFFGVGMVSMGLVWMGIVLQHKAKAMRRSDGVELEKQQGE
jgi:hypothetical protein